MPINLLDTYEPLDVSGDLRLMHFNTYCGGETVRIRAFISNTPHPFMPDVYNLAFGPPLEGTDTGVEDQVEIRHDNIDKVLSTLLLFAYTYLYEHPGQYVGIDGSCNIRAALYYRKLQANYSTLIQVFPIIAGNKYYIRFRRFNKPNNNAEDENQFALALVDSIKENLDYNNIIALPEAIDPAVRITMNDNFNYFTFKVH